MLANGVIEFLLIIVCVFVWLLPNLLAKLASDHENQSNRTPPARPNQQRPGQAQGAPTAKNRDQELEDFLEELGIKRQSAASSTSRPHDANRSGTSPPPVPPRPARPQPSAQRESRRPRQETARPTPSRMASTQPRNRPTQGLAQQQAALTEALEAVEVVDLMAQVERQQSEIRSLRERLAQIEGDNWGEPAEKMSSAARSLRLMLKNGKQLGPALVVGQMLAKPVGMGDDRPYQ